jgi:hypothetical protein
MNLSASTIIAGAITVLALIAGLAIYKRTHASEVDWDVKVVAQLAVAGSDFRKPHPIEFFFYFPSERAAQRVAGKLTQRGFASRVEAQTGTTAAWLTFATRSMLVDVAELRRLRAEFEELSRVEGGTYDGWGTQVVK